MRRDYADAFALRDHGHLPLRRRFFGAGML
jgi:hypothetical protein